MLHSARRSSSKGLDLQANADTIWQIPAYLPYLQPPLTPEAVALAEEAIGYKLPTEYLDLLRKQNGGYIRFALPDLPHDTVAGIGPYFPSLTDFDWEHCIDEVSFPLTGLIPFDGDGHWYLCLDYRLNSTVPTVTYVDVESDHQSDVAGTFGAYLTKLRLDIGDIYVIESVTELERATTHLASALGTEFEAPETQSYGYPTHRAALKRNGASGWVWISPNRVKRGFVRPEDARYEELNNMLPGEADRYPGLPANCYLLSATGNALPSVLDAFVRSQLSVNPLSKYLR